MSFRSARLAGAAFSLFLALVPAAHATEGWYTSFEGGGSWIDDWDHVDRALKGPPVASTSAFDGGWTVLGAVGHGRDNWRFELEGSYRFNAAASLVVGGTTIPGLAGEMTEASAMLNLIHDIPLAERLSLSVGIGAGGDHADLKLNAPGGTYSHEGWRFAYQGLVGLNRALDERLSLFVNYRFLNVTAGDYDDMPALRVEGEDLQKHAATVGLRFALAAPAAAPPVPEPPRPPLPALPAEREFLVFFGFNSAKLSPQALETVRQAASAAMQLGTANIRVVGHADRSGRPAYNKALSLRRAETVKAEMVREGVMGSAIRLRGLGESQPLVQTTDGTREPQNRRVQIVF